MTWRNNLAAKWGCISHISFGVLLLLAGISMLPIKVTYSRGLFFIGSQLWCGCLFVLWPVPAISMILIPSFLQSYAGRFCSGELMDESGGQYGNESLREESKILYRIWVSLLIFFFVGAPVVLLANGYCIKSVLNLN